MIEIATVNIVENSLAVLRPDLAKQWDYSKNEKTPEEYKFRSNKKVWWLCDICSYNWESIITNRSRNSHNKCPNCNGRVLNEDNNLEAKYPEIVKQWNYEKNENITPRDVFAVGHAKYWWKCEHGHEWEAVIHNRVRGRGCPHCNKKHFTSYAEQAFYFYIKQVFEDAINNHKESNGESLIEFDIFIPSYGIAVEYDGVWYHDNEKREDNDIAKDIFALDNNYKLIRVREKGLIAMIFSHNILDCDPYRTNLNDKIKEVLLLISSFTDDESIKNKIDGIKVSHQEDSHLILDGLNTVTREDSIAITHSYLLEYWSKKNKRLLPQSLTYGSSQKVWWECPECNHEWKCDTKHMVKRKIERLCARCCDIKVESLQVRQPEVAKLWHPDKNGDLTPYDVKPNSKERVHWINEDGSESYCMVKSKVDLINFKKRKNKLKQEKDDL